MMDKKTRDEKNQKVILILIFGIFGLIFLAGGIDVIYRTFLVRTWPTTTGQIIVSGFRWEDNFRRGLASRYWSGSHNLHIQYMYLVEGQRYYSDQIGPRRFIGQGTTFQMNAERIVEQYPKGKEVTVYYNPANPREAVICVQLKWTYVALVLGGVVFLVLSYLAYAGPARNE